MGPKKGPLNEDMVLVSVTEDRRLMLERMRQRLSQEIDICGDHRALCLLAAQLRAVLAELDELPGDAMGAADEIRARRDQRRAAPRGKGRRSGAAPA